MEVVGYTPEQAEVSVLKLQNLTWPLNTLPRQGHINTFDSGVPAYSVEMSTGYQLGCPPSSRSTSYYIAGNTKGLEAYWRALGIISQESRKGFKDSSLFGIIIRGMIWAHYKPLLLFYRSR